MKNFAKIEHFDERARTDCVSFVYTLSGPCYDLYVLIESTMHLLTFEMFTFYIFCINFVHGSSGSWVILQNLLLNLEKVKKMF